MGGDSEASGRRPRPAGFVLLSALVVDRTASPRNSRLPGRGPVREAGDGGKTGREDRFDPVLSAGPALCSVQAAVSGGGAVSDSVIRVAHHRQAHAEQGARGEDDGQALPSRASNDEGGRLSGATRAP